METHARFFLIGIFSLLVTGALILFVLWLGKLQLDREYQDYDVRFHESVSGLSIGGIVQYHGIQVGEVRRLGLDADDPREVRVRIRVPADTPIKTDTRAQLSYTGLTGVAVVELFGGSPGAPLLREHDPSAAPEIDTVPSTLSQLMSGGSGAMHSAQEVMARIAEVLSDDNINRVSALLDNLAQVSDGIRTDYPAFRQALADARELEQRLTSAAGRADALLADLQRGVGAGEQGESLLAEARAAVQEVREAAGAIEQFGASGERTLAGIDTQARTDLAATLAALRETSVRLARISQRFEESPAQYLLQDGRLPEYPVEKPR